ncbi:hypothetical protein AVEN_112245-1 [Araneus ventricosus]|uniref:Reverse transcriptase RNase H-like domain-containing protein n=1 Tax=Araneus ventricosus TaxID=182803 RepID=A0A4Y2H4Z2_ARAVE|nr:hypothetical protein AVEN_112245-1 [Araneus ventricosus]
MKKNGIFKWEKVPEELFETLKRELTIQPISALYSPEVKTEVHTDACVDGIAGMLLQLGSDNKWHLVYCMSKKTTETENKYHSSKLELMAIVWTLEGFRQFLLDISFTVVSECQALIYMNAKKSSNHQIARWSLLFQEFNFEICHGPGVRMFHIDAISKAPVLNSSDTLDSLIENKLEVCLTLSVEDQVLMMQHADDTLKELILILKKDNEDRIKEEKQKVQNYVLKGNGLFCVINYGARERLLFVIPKSKDGILRLFADEEHEVWNDLEKVQLEAREKIAKGQEKMKAYYDKKKSGTLLFDKGEIMVVRRNPKATGESTKAQSRYRGPMVVTEILPSDTYRISQLEPSNGRLYATTARVRELKAWNEDDDEPGMQRPKRTVCKPVRSGDFIPDR